MGLNAPIMGYLSLSQTGAGSFLTYRMQHLAGKNDYLSALARQRRKPPLRAFGA